MSTSFFSFIGKKIWKKFLCQIGNFKHLLVISLFHTFLSKSEIFNPTFGAGIRLLQYGFDFGYTAGEQGHPRANTMFFSSSIIIKDLFTKNYKIFRYSSIQHLH